MKFFQAIKFLIDDDIEASNAYHDAKFAKDYSIIGLLYRQGQAISVTFKAMLHRFVPRKAK